MTERVLSEVYKWKRWDVGELC